MTPGAALKDCPSQPACKSISLPPAPVATGQALHVFLTRLVTSYTATERAMRRRRRSKWSSGHREALVVFGTQPWLLRAG